MHFDGLILERRLEQQRSVLLWYHGIGDRSSENRCPRRCLAATFEGVRLSWFWVVKWQTKVRERVCLRGGWALMVVVVVVV